MKSKRLRFVRKVSDVISGLRLFDSTLLPGGRKALNKTEWRGHEPRSCAATNISTRPHAVGDPNPTIADIEVTYRPKGFISYVGNTKYDGWTAMVINRSEDGTLIDAEGKPLKENAPPVYVPKEVYGDAEFNDIDFGDFVDECEIEDVKYTTVEAVLEEIKQSGSFNFSAKGSFIAAHRTRPQTKIILSNAPSGQGFDGFGTRIVNINLSTPQLEHVLMEALTALMCDVLEGKASVNSAANDNLMFVQLSDTVVDCEPNEMGLDSWFDMLHAYTPMDFLDNLAKRLMSIYEVQVEVIKGKDCGLVLRRDTQAKK